jgi:hypothetical protein
MPTLLERTLQSQQYQAARRMHCNNNEQQIVTAIHNFNDKHHALPARFTVDEKDQPLHSWRVLLLPFLGETELYEEIRLNEPWDSEHNQQFHSRMPSVYACPSNNHSGTTDRCCYSAIAGKGKRGNECALTPAKEAKLLTGTTHLTSIADNLSNIVLVIEVKEPFCWMDPLADKTFADLETISTEHSSFHSEGFNVVLGDGSVRFISNTIDPNILRSLATRHGGEPVPQRPSITLPSRLKHSFPELMESTPSPSRPTPAHPEPTPSPSRPIPAHPEPTPSPSRLTPSPPEPRFPPSRPMRRNNIRDLLQQ